MKKCCYPLNTATLHQEASLACKSQTCRKLPKKEKFTCSGNSQIFWNNFNNICAHCWHAWSTSVQHLRKIFCHPGVSLNRISAIGAQLMTPPLLPVKPLLHGSGWQMECAYSAWDWCLPEWRISQEFVPTSVGPETSDSWIVTRRYFYLWSKLFIQHPTIGPGWSRFNRKFWEITELGFHPPWHFFLIWFANEKIPRPLTEWLNEWMNEWMNGWVKQTKVSPIDGWK